jgi:hypothetical protein
VTSTESLPFGSAERNDLCHLQMAFICQKWSLALSILHGATVENSVQEENLFVVAIASFNII